MRYRRHLDPERHDLTDQSLRIGRRDPYVRRLKGLGAEHSRLKQMYADLSLENQALKDVIEKSCEAGRQA